MNMRARITLPMAALLALSGLSCGGGGSDKPLTPTEFCTMKATTECQVVGRCATVSMESCLTARRAVCDQLVASQTVAPRVFTPANVGTCIARTNSAYSKSTILPTDLDAMDVACKYVFQGNVALGGTCTVNYDCAGATNGTIICDKTLCGRKVTKNLNDLCGNPGEVCNTGSYCTSDGAVMKCLAKKTLADTCDPATAPCAEMYRCTGGTCMTRMGLLGACTTNDDCMAPAAPYCDKYAGNVCDTGLTFATSSPSCVDYGGSAGGGGNDAATTSDGGGG